MTIHALDLEKQDSFRLMPLCLAVLVPILYFLEVSFLCNFYLYPFFHYLQIQTYNTQRLMHLILLNCGCHK